MVRQRKLTPERKEFINSLLGHYNPKDAKDVQEMLKDLFPAISKFSPQICFRLK